MMFLQDVLHFAGVGTAYLNVPLVKEARLSTCSSQLEVIDAVRQYGWIFYTLSTSISRVLSHDEVM